MADVDILPGISAARCSSLRHLTYITPNMNAHANREGPTHTYTVLTNARAHAHAVLSYAHVRVVSRNSF